VIVISVDFGEETAETVEITISSAVFEAISEAEAAVEIVIETPIATLAFDSLALETIAEAGEEADDIVITASIVDNSELDEIFQDIVKDRPVYNFTVTVGEETVSNFMGGKVTVGIPYELREDENAYAIVVYYLDDDGNLKLIRGYYDEENSVVVFVTGHFSKYMLEFVEILFTDIDIDWFNKAAIFVGARELIPGLDKNSELFAPDTKLTRGELLSALLNAYGIEMLEADEDFENFADFDAESIYADYITTAKILGIAKGYLDGTFRAENEITREEMFTLLYRILDEIGETPKKSADGLALEDFADAETVGAWCEAEIAALLASGLIKGVSEEELVFDPQGDAIRAEMAVMILRLIMGVAD